LHIVSRYIDLMGGRIEVQSQLEKGTEFTINFNV
jgi:signal transduction histidine kinase